MRERQALSRKRLAAPRRVAPLFRDFVEGAWKEAHFDGYRPSTRMGVRSLLDRQLLPAFGSKPLDRIAPAQVGRWFDRFSRTAPGNANHALDLLTQIINFAIARGHLETNPARDVKRNPRRMLTRFLSREEVSLGSIASWTGRPATAVESRRISSCSCS